LQKALADDTVEQRLAELGTAPAASGDATSDALKKKLEEEIARWKPVIEGAGEYAD
jgi:tripartite-type tricarboxylate transporter receptor subunit TctC